MAMFIDKYVMLIYFKFAFVFTLLLENITKNQPGHKRIFLFLIFLILLFNQHKQYYFNHQIIFNYAK